MLHILDAISDSGSAGRPNEDAFGRGHSHAWVIDGATGVAASELLDAPSDAHWLAQTASAFFAAHADRYGAALARLTRNPIEEMRRLFDAGRSRSPKARYALPRPERALVHSDGSHIHCVNFAACP